MFFRSKIKKFADKTSEDVVNKYFNINSSSKHYKKELKKLYFDVLIYGYLKNLCSHRISLNKSAKKSYLLCEHAIISNTKTKKLLQKYSKSKSIKNNYFPSHRREAIDYFEVCLYSLIYNI